MGEKRLRRSTRDRVLAGVCGGFGHYFSIDPVLIRVAWVIFCLAGGSGLLAYIICAIIIPEEDDMFSSF
ncbi:MAG: PspC domain-containing protein [Lachnospiraceae bacterium]|nr:PspC domain-containing protein [Lachnospiraceae bacterium]